MYRTITSLFSRDASERASTSVEYVGLAAVIAMLMSGVASVIDSATGDRITHALIERLLIAISG